MVFDFYTKKIKVFVAEVSDDVQELHDHLIKVLARAGMEVLCLDKTKISNNQELIEMNKVLLNQADCSLHLLGNSIGVENQLNGNQSIVEFQLNQAQNRNQNEWRDFKIFIWQPAFISKNISAQEDNFISSIRQGILHNMIFSNRNSVVSFVEDIRSVMYGGKPEEFDTEKADLFFIYNALDHEEANEIISFVSDVVNLKKLEIALSNDIDYSELVVQQIKKSKMVVVYYKNTSSWALPFVQQVWKKVGGASSKTPILFIGDSNIPANQNIEFEAAMVISKIVAQEIIPIEIKVQFDNISEQAK